MTVAHGHRPRDGPRDPLRVAVPRGRLAARAGGGRRRRPLRPEVPRRRPGPAGAGGGADRRRARARGGAAGAGDRVRHRRARARGRRARRRDPRPAEGQPGPEPGPRLPARVAGLRAGRRARRSTRRWRRRSVWLDRLLQNVDRTANNPNLLVWHGRVWLIDHGAALYPHHGDPLLADAWRAPVPADRRARAPAGGRAHRPRGRAPGRAARRRRRSPAIVGAVPDAWLDDTPDVAGPDERRAAYAAHLRPPARRATPSCPRRPSVPARSPFQYAILRAVPTPSAASA